MATKNYKLKADSNFDPSKIKIAKQVRLPVWRWVDDVPKYYRIEAPITIRPDDESTSKLESGTAQVTNLETGDKAAIFIAPFLLQSFNEHYPKESYVGKCFVSRQIKVEGKRFRDYSLDEIEV